MYLSRFFVFVFLCIDYIEERDMAQLWKKVDYIKNVLPFPVTV